MLNPPEHPAPSEVSGTDTDVGLDIPGQSCIRLRLFHRETIKTRREAMPFSLLLPHIFCVRKV